MQIEWTVTVGNLITALIIAGGWVWWFFKLSARSQTNSKASKDALAAADAAKTAAEDAAKDVDRLRLEMTRDFASLTHLKEVEGRLIGAVNNLTNEIGQLRAFLMQHGSGHE